MTKRESLLTTIGIILIAFNLRAPITAVGSIIKLIQEQYSLSAVAAGIITTLPLVAFAVVSPFVTRVSRRIGSGKLMTYGLLLIILGEIIRSYTNCTGLYLGTMLLGVGIAIGNVLIPSIIKSRFANKLGVMTSLYVSSMCIFAAVGAGASIPLAEGLDLGWNNALASWLLLALVTTLFWLPQIKYDQSAAKAIASTSTPTSTPTRSIWRSRTAWWVTLFMGVQSLIFYSLVAWLPTIIVAKGLSTSFSGSMALLFQLVAIPATLSIPIVCDRRASQRRIVIGVCAIYLLGMILFFFSDTTALITLSTTLMSLGMGGSISLSIAFIALRSNNAHKTSELSGMSQSAGYLLAALGPILLGFIYDRLHTWDYPIILLSILILLLALCGIFAGRDRNTEHS